MLIIFLSISVGMNYVTLTCLNKYINLIYNTYIFSCSEYLWIL